MAYLRALITGSKKIILAAYKEHPFTILVRYVDFEVEEHS
jgi:hypothetical protein